MNVLLIGPRAAGKTTIGRLLASRLNRTFVDLDDLALAKFPAQSIREVWAIHGEDEWRIAESQSLTGALQKDNQVVALGGGAPMIPVVRAALHEARTTNSAIVVYLKCPVEVLRQRLQSDSGDRPSLTGSNVVDEVSKVLRLREPVYLELADLVHESRSGSPQVAAELLAEMVGERARR